jgi:hypothetical protein
MANLLLLIIVAAVAGLLVFLKANSGLVFLALCSGDVLVNFANKNMAYVNGHINSRLIPSHFTISQPSLEIAIILAPAVLVILLVRHTSGPTKWLLQIPPAIATGLLGALLVTPLLSLKIQNSVMKNNSWSLLEKNQIPVVAAGVLVSVLVVAFTSHSHRIPSKHSHKN